MGLVLVLVDTLTVIQYKLADLFLEDTELAAQWSKPGSYVEEALCER
jgi:hypothetical protein